MDLNETAVSIHNATSNLPAPIKQNLVRAIDRLCTAVVNVPLAWLEGIVGEKRAKHSQKIAIINEQTKRLIEKVDASDDQVKTASARFVARELREQNNINKTTQHAIDELNSLYADREDVTGSTTEDSVKEIGEDWLNEFENLAKLKTSEEMQLAFGKILAGEIQRPGAFSIRTLKILSELDNEAAIKFQLVCSMSVCYCVQNYGFDVRILSLGDSLGLNSLKDFGVTFSTLNILNEYGLIQPDYNSNLNYNGAVVSQENKVESTLFYGKRHLALRPQDQEEKPRFIKVHGAGFTQAGRELFSIVPIKENRDFTETLSSYFLSQGYTLVDVNNMPYPPIMSRPRSKK